MLNHDVSFAARKSLRVLPITGRTRGVAFLEHIVVRQHKVVTTCRTSRSPATETGWRVSADSHSIDDVSAVEEYSETDDNRAGAALNSMRRLAGDTLVCARPYPANSVTINGDTFATASCRGETRSSCRANRDALRNVVPRSGGGFPGHILARTRSAEVVAMAICEEHDASGPVRLHVAAKLPAQLGQLRQVTIVRNRDHDLDAPGKFLVRGQTADLVIAVRLVFIDGSVRHDRISPYPQESHFIILPFGMQVLDYRFSDSRQHFASRSRSTAATIAAAHPTNSIDAGTFFLR